MSYERGKLQRQSCHFFKNVYSVESQLLPFYFFKRWYNCKTQLLKCYFGCLFSLCVLGHFGLLALACLLYMYVSLICNHKSLILSIIHFSMALCYMLYVLKMHVLYSSTIPNPDVSRYLFVCLFVLCLFIFIISFQKFCKHQGFNLWNMSPKINISWVYSKYMLLQNQIISNKFLKMALIHWRVTTYCCRCQPIIYLPSNFLAKKNLKK